MLAKKNACRECRVLSITTCPILEAEYLANGAEYLEECAWQSVVQKVFDSAKYSHERLINQGGDEQ